MGEYGGQAPKEICSYIIKQEFKLFALGLYLFFKCIIGDSVIQSVIYIELLSQKSKEEQHFLN
jgi:hypothetical protein